MTLTRLFVEGTVQGQGFSLSDQGPCVLHTVTGTHGPGSQQKLKKTAVVMWEPLESCGETFYKRGRSLQPPGAVSASLRL